MDKSWMGVDRTTSLYAKGVESFMKFAIENANDTSLIRCPCTKCGNMRLLEPKLIKCHLFTNGIFLNTQLGFGMVRAVVSNLVG